MKFTFNEVFEIYITLSTLDLPARLKDLNKQLEKNIADAAKFTEKTKPGKIENNKQEYKRLSFLREQEYSMNI